MIKTQCSKLKKIKLFKWRLFPHIPHRYYIVTSRYQSPLLRHGRTIQVGHFCDLFHIPVADYRSLHSLDTSIRSSSFRVNAQRLAYRWPLSVTTLSKKNAFFFPTSKFLFSVIGYLYSPPYFFMKGCCSFFFEKLIDKD